jgi:hypothetical protein
MGETVTWLCEGCRHVVLLTIVTTERQARIDHVIDVHRDDLLSGRLKILTGPRPASAN